MPEKIGKYEVRLQLGRGGMGVVYEGFDPVIGRRVAIKTLRTENIESEDLPEFLARFKREAQSAGRLSHPHIVTIHEYGEQDGMPYIVMEYIQGRDLSQDLKRGIRFPLDAVVRMMTQLLGALGHAHEAGVVHRDIKPQNIILLDDGSLKVVDFGIARIEESEAFTKTGAMIGTPAYMSPEQVLGQHVTAKSDIFSAGTVLYQLLTGDRPFSGDEWSIKQKVLKQDPMPPSDLNPTLGAPWDAVILRAMAKKPEARYDTARQFLEAIRTAAEAEQRAAEEDRRKRIEAEEHANREAAARSREEARRRERAEYKTSQKQAEAARAEAERAAVERAKREATDRTVAPPVPPASTAKPRTPAFAAIAAIVVLAAGGYLFTRSSIDGEAARAEAARIAAESKLKEEAEKRALAEALAREESEKRSKLEADAKAQTEQAARARAEEEAKKAAEEKSRALALKKEEEDRRKAEALAKKDAEAKAFAAAETQRIVALKAQREAEDRERSELARKADELEKSAAKAALDRKLEKPIPDRAAAEKALPKKESPMEGTPDKGAPLIAKRDGAVSNPAARASKPGWPSHGDRWVYAVRDRDRRGAIPDLTVEIREVTANSIIESLSGGGLSPLTQTHRAGMKLTGIAPGLVIFSPYVGAFQEVKVGDRWSDIDYQNLPMPTDQDARFKLPTLSARVVANENVSVRAGAFQARKILAELRVGRHTFEFTYWYSDAVKRFVKYQARPWHGSWAEPIMEMELVSYSVAIAAGGAVQK